MHSYSAYNLCVHSDIELPNLAPGGDEPDVAIRLGELDEDELMRGPRGGQRVTEHLYYEPLDSDVLFSIEGGESIVLHPLKPIELEVLQGWVVGILMATLLRQRGLFVLHGSAVAKDGAAVAFLGGSGWGKSTLAAAFTERGYHFLTDDMLVLDMTGERPRVLPGHRFIRLHTDAASRLVGEIEALPTVSSYTTKRVRAVDRVSDEAFPLEKVYVLDTASAEAHAVEPLGRQEALLHVVLHTRSKDLLTEPSVRTSHLAECARLLQQVPVASLRRIRSLDALPDLLDTIEADLATLRLEVDER
jgi:hypothetical protein